MIEVPDPKSRTLSSKIWTPFQAYHVVSVKDFLENKHLIEGIRNLGSVQEPWWWNKAIVGFTDAQLYRSGSDYRIVDFTGEIPCLSLPFYLRMAGRDFRKGPLHIEQEGWQYGIDTLYDPAKDILYLLKVEKFGPKETESQKKPQPDLEGVICADTVSV